MAKRGRRPISDTQISDSTSAAISSVEGFAEDLGRLLGTARAKAEGWIGQRQNVAKQLTDIRDTAADLLQQITGGGARMAAAVGRARQGRPKASQQPGEYAPAPQGKRKRRKLSAKARRAISLAQKKRWAKIKSAPK
jgi:hypothetical protein